MKEIKQKEKNVGKGGKKKKAPTTDRLTER
jgi:hypothetical protein